MEEVTLVLLETTDEVLLPVDEVHGFCLEVDGKEGVWELAVLAVALWKLVVSGERTQTLGIFWDVSVELVLFSLELIARVRHTVKLKRPVSSSTSVWLITIAVDVELADLLEEAGTDRSRVIRRFVVAGESESRSSPAEPVHGSTKKNDFLKNSVKVIIFLWF